jgi:TolA-binding protein
MVSLWAQPTEDRAFTALTKMFEDGLYEFAARDAAEFTTRFPDSPRRTEAGLLEAQALLELGRFEAALARLGELAAPAGDRADEFAFWQAETRLRQGDRLGAAQAFTQFLAAYPASPRRLEAAVQQARARYRLGDLATASAHLRDPEGPFQTSARSAPTHPWAHQGWLLLAELLIGLNDLPAAEAVLAQMAEAPLSPAAAWERQLLLARAHLAAARLPEALGYTTNLWNQATNLVSRELLAEAAALQGSLCEALQQNEAALQAYERNLGTNVPPAQRRFALEKVVGLGRQQGPAASAQRLEAFIDRLPQDELLDLARFALGEVRLADYHRLGAAPAPVPPETLAARTNALAQARVQFEWVLAHRPESPLAGRAELNRGWCLWEEGGPRLAEAAGAFRAATARLAPSTDQANARFKWADCQARTGDLAGALTNYWLVATNHLEARIPDTLRSEALFQVVRTSLQAGEFGMATAAVERLAQQEGGGELAQSAELLLARTFSQRGQPEPARAQYEAFLQRYTNSTLIPDVRLAIARTFEQRGDYGAALASYAGWLAHYTNAPGLSTGLVAQATFDHARLSFRTRPDAAAVGLLTNFVARFPAHSNAPLAQYLVADHAFAQGDFARAELLFRDRLLAPSTTPPGDELPYRARLMAGKAAVFRSSWPNAREHFDWIITNGPLHVVSSPLPLAVVAEAYVARGDLFLLEPGDRAANPLTRYEDALTAFAKVAERLPPSEWAPRAWGRIGDCHLQLATQDPARYDAAAEAYGKVLESPADPTLRSMAEVALGLVREKQAALKPANEQGPLLEAAMAHYLNVFYEKNLRAGELPDPSWLKQAGLDAVKLAEALKRWDVALGLYQRLVTELAPLRARFEKRIAELRQLAATPTP